MKKILTLTLAILMLTLALTSCNFNISGSILDATSTPKVEAMMEALAKGDLTSAKTLLHPDRTDGEKYLPQMVDYLDGRGVSSLEVTGKNVTTSVGSGGNVTQEQVTYKATLTDDTVIYLSTVYLTNDTGEGFVSFQMVLGMV